MKQFKNFILEAMGPEDLKQFILNHVNDLDELSLYKTYRKVAKSLNIEPEESDFDIRFKVDESALRRYLRAKNISVKLLKSIIKLFDDYNLNHMLVSIIKGNEISLPMGSEVFQDTMVPTDLIEFLANYEFKNNITGSIYHLPKELLLELAGMKTQGIGSFEVLCDLLFQDITKTGSGDVTTSNGSYELKQNGGRVMYKDIKSAEVIDDAFKTSFQQITGEVPNIKSNNGFFYNVDVIKAVVEELNNYLSTNPKDIEKIADLIAYSFLSQHMNSAEIPNSIELKTASEFLISQKIINKKGNKIEISPLDLQRFIGCIQLYFYQHKDNWDNIIVLSDSKSRGKGEDKEDYIADGLYVKISAHKLRTLKETLKNIWNNKNIKFTGYPKYGKGTSAQDNAVHIRLVRK